MERVRWYWLLAMYGTVGLLAAWTMISFNRASVIAIVLVAPIVALSLPFAFVELVRGLRDRVACFTWWHLLWFCIFLSGLVFRIRTVQDIRSGAVDSAALFRLALEFFTFLVLSVRLALRKTEWISSLFRGLVGCLTAYGLVCFASTVWSAYPAWTAFKSLEYLLDVVLLGAILASIDSIESYKDFLDWTWTLTGLALLTVWVGIIVAPDLALRKMEGIFGWQFQGVLPAISADTVGELGAALGIVSFARLILRSGGVANRVWYHLLFLVSCTTMFFAQARTAMAGFGLGVMCILLFSRRWLLAAFLTFTGMLAMVPLLITGWLQAYIQRGDSDQRIATLSSRLDWWRFAWDKFIQQPLIGYGAYAAGRFVVMAGLQMNSTATMHSDWVEIMVGTSFWGLIPALLSVFGSWWVLLSLFADMSLDSANRALTIEVLGMLAMLTLRSVFNDSCFWHPPLIFLAVLGYAEFMRRHRLNMPELPAEAELVGMASR